MRQRASHRRCTERAVVPAMLGVVLLATSLGACGPTPVRPVRVGGDRDAHGCLPSAGYAWCAREQQCTRPWELAAAKGFENSAPAFKAYCETGAR